MKSQEDNSIFTIRGVQTFLDKNAAVLPNSVKTGLRHDLDTDFQALITNATVQASGNLNAQGATQKHRSLRTILLRDHMAPIAAIAAAKLPQVPELSRLRMPQGTPKIEALTAAANAMADAAATFSDVFITAGQPSDFIAQLNQATTALLTPLGDRAASRAARAGATKGLGTRAVNARRTLRAINTIVQRALKDNAELLAAWNTTRRIPKSRVTTTATPSPVTPTTTAAPSTPTPVAAPTQASTDAAPPHSTTA